MSNAQELIACLHTKLGYETVKPTVSENQIRLEGRVNSNQSRNWVVACRHLLSVSEQAAWSLDLSRHYFNRDGIMVYTWRLIFQAENVAQYIPHIMTSLGNTPRARVEVEEQALPGVRGQRTMQSKSGKGAAPSGSVPLLIRQRGGMG